MGRKLFLLGFLCLLFLGFVGFKFILLNAQDTFGKIRVVSSPSSTIFIDNIAVGKTPYEEKIKIGEYLVKLIPEATATQTASWQGKVRIFKNALSYINRELGPTDLASAGEILTVTKMEKTTNPNYGEIFIETEPSGSIVYLDNDEKGVSPAILADVVKGDHELSVFMPGFLRRTEKIKVEPGYRVNTHFKLAIDPNQQKIPTDEPAEEATKSATQSSTTNKFLITIKDTPTGFLRVREEPSISASESGRVKPGDTFDLLDEKEGWYKIVFEKNKQGWVYSQYADKEKK
ncbi:PEGA domain-containing protein [Candidatus Roizmanbacteria bacterium]|nr:PEGA domain-containing protein [Candidatus Roizmanbacteria bacterium]